MFFVKCLQHQVHAAGYYKKFVNWIWPIIVEMENECFFQVRRELRFLFHEQFQDQIIILW